MPTHYQRMALRAVCLLVLVLPALATCPVTLPSSAFAGAVTPCSSPPSLTALCTQCLPAVAGPFVVAGVSASDAVTLGLCIQSSAVAVLTAGVNATSLAALASCSTPSPPPSTASPPPPPTTPSCPVSQTQNFAAAVTPCANPINACTSCATALATPFVLQGVSPSDKTTLGVCINAQISAIMTAGVSPTTLAALAGCGSSPSAPPPSPPAIPVASHPPSAITCPVSQPQNFSAAVGPCANPINACTSCLTALAMPFILAGVSPSSPSIIAACIMAQSSVMVSAGVSSASLAALSGCGAPVPSPPPIASPPPLIASPPPLISSPPPNTTPSCPVSQTQSFTSAVTPCANAGTACTTCVTALAMPFILSGVSPSDVTTLAVCINAQMSAIIAAGVSPATLFALTSCGATQPPPPLSSPPPQAAPNPPASVPTASPPPQAAAAICPVTTTLSYAAVTPCSVPSNLCTSCLTALATPIILAGVPPSSTAVIAACITAQFTAMVAAGVSPTTIMGLASCGATPSAAPPPPQAAAVTPSPPPVQPGSASAASSPPPPGAPAVPTLACTVAHPIDFTAAVQPCSNASNACGPCLQALAASVIRAGVRYNNTAAWISCFETHSLEMLAAGVPLSTLTAMNWCTARSYLLAAPPAPTSMPPSPPPAWSQLNMFDLSSGAQGVGPWRLVAAAVVALLLA